MKKTSLTKIAILASMISATSMAMAADTWPNLPEGIKSGVGVQVGSVVYVGLGAAGDSFYAMDVEAEKPQWKELASFEGAVPGGAAAAAADGKIYIFSGSGKAKSTDKAPIIFEDVYAYDIESNKWSKVKTKTPVGFLGASAYAVSDTEIAVFGGYNKEKFDTYLGSYLGTDDKAERKQIADKFMSMAPEGYNWNKQIQIYNVTTNSWSVRGETPYLANCGSALVGNGNDVTLISGEIKPGLRTPMVKKATINTDGVTWEELAQLPTPLGSELQEGVAGSYAGMSNGALLVAGGANFRGARAQSIRGKWYAHEGFGKAFNPEVYAYRDGGWKQTATELPEGLAYGSSFTTPKGVLIVGGEDGKRKARGEVYMMSYNGTDVDIVD